MRIFVNYMFSTCGCNIYGNDLGNGCVGDHLLRLILVIVCLFLFVDWCRNNIVNVCDILHANLDYNCANDLGNDCCDDLL